MYLDNILARSNQTESSISYHEILLDSIEVNSAVQDSEVFAITSEFSKHTLGSEAVSEWWPKIKAFFKKVWEAVKRLLSKVVAWLAALPSKLVAICKKIYTLWVKRGVEGRVKNLRDNIKKNIVHLDAEAAEDFKNTDWGIQDPDIIDEAIAKVNEALGTGDTKAGTDKISEKLGTGANDAKKFIRSVCGMESFDAEITKKVLEGLAAANAVDEDSVTVKEVIKEDILPAVQNAVSDIIDADRSKSYEVSEAKISEWFESVKNDKMAKAYEKVSKRSSRFIEYLDRFHKNASKAFDNFEKDDDEDGAKALIAGLKAVNQITSAVILADGFFAKLYATCALNTAKMLNAAIKCYVSGADKKGNKQGKGDSNGGETNPIRDPANQRQNSIKNRQQVPHVDIPGVSTPDPIANIPPAPPMGGLSVTDKAAFASDPDMLAFLEM